jgi:hypothetical protein
VRTTLTLDDDVAKLLRAEIRRSGDSFKSVANRCLRLAFLKSSVVTPKPFVVQPRSLGLPPGLDYDCVAELIESLEGISHK